MKYKISTALFAVLFFVTLAYAFELNQMIPKATPIGTDRMGIEDSENGWQVAAVELRALPVSEPTTAAISGALQGYDALAHDFTNTVDMRNTVSYKTGLWRYANTEETFYTSASFATPTANNSVLFGDFEMAVPNASSVAADGMIILNAITDAGQANVTLFTPTTCADQLATAANGDICIGD